MPLAKGENMHRSKILSWCICAVAAGYAFDASAVAAKKQSAIQNGTSVRARVEASGLYDQECYDAYYGCMDQFCITDNTNGGSCGCSDESEKYESALNDIRATLQEAERLSTIEVEKIKAGASADIVFTGTREYDENGNLKGVNELLDGGSREKKRADLLALWTSAIEEDDDVFGGGGLDIADMTGAALYRAADELCREQISDQCAKDYNFLRQVYSRQITADCKAFENTVNAKRSEADIALAQANADVRAALKESLDSANKYDLGQCMVEFKKCMLTADACGDNWENCVSVIAYENMQNNAAVSTAKTKVATVNKYDITASTMEILESKRTICENVLGQCMAVRNQVWPAFLREAAPTIKVAESAAESKFRQSCLTNISNCITTACRDDIVGRGTATMDACLSRPDMARSFCKVEIDPCERMEPLIWDYVVDKLAAMRVDACTAEVKDCFTDDTRCGANFQNCIGMDYDYIHDICPEDKLIVCKAIKPKFNREDLDKILMGLYLNIDNSFLDQCQELVDRKMAEICGSTTDCNRFAADDSMGAGSIRSQKDGTIYRVSGMISFGSIKMGDASGRTVDVGADGMVRLGPGEIGVAEYIARVRERNAGIADTEGTIALIEEELNNIAGTINRTIEMIENDPQIQFCTTGRNLSQITGKNETTAGRFPHLLDQIKMQIAVAALRQAQTNYNNKLNATIAAATHDVSADLAQYMCQKMAQNGSVAVAAASGGTDTPLTPPYAISYDVASGLSASDLTLGGTGEVSFTSDNGSGMIKETTALFNRDTRNCHICTTVSTQSCTVKGGNWFRKKNTSCTTTASDPMCEDVQM